MAKFVVMTAESFDHPPVKILFGLPASYSPEDRRAATFEAANRHQTTTVLIDIESDPERFLELARFDPEELPSTPEKLNFYISRSNSGDTRKTHVQTERNDEDGSGIWIDLIPDSQQVIGSIKLEVYEGRLLLHVWDDLSTEDAHSTLVVAEKFDQFLHVVTQLEAANGAQVKAEPLPTLLDEARALLYKYSDEVEYQLSERHHDDEGLAEWQEDKRQLDDLLVRLDKTLKERK